jgi:hypothetical protein
MKGRASSRILLLILVAGSLSRFSTAATFTVTNTNDSGPGSLRQAILDANANAGLDTVVFAIGSGPQTIAPLSALPTISDPVVIDGRTQPGYAGTPLIELSGASAGAGVDGLDVAAGNSTIFALVINRFRSVFLGGGGNGIVLRNAGSNSVSFCVIGADPGGTVPLSNTAAGIWISGSADNRVSSSLIAFNGPGVLINGAGSDYNLVQSNTIRSNFQSGVAILSGTGNLVGLGIVAPNIIVSNQMHGVLIGGSAVTTGVIIARIGTDGATALPNGGDGVRVDGSSTAQISACLISGNSGNGILLINGASGCQVLGNQIGTDITGMIPIGNGLNGIIASAASGNTIGSRNIICANGTNGIRLRSGASGNIVTQNSIGVNRGGAGLPNVNDGIQINDGAVNNSIGTLSSPQDANIISGNGANGVRITDASTTGNVVQNNLIGTAADGIGSLANAGHGVLIENAASGNAVGGAIQYSLNRIAFNKGAGVFVDSGTGNTIRGNSIFRNNALGIDLAPAGVTPNDHCDSDSGPNGLQNFPALLSASSLSGTTTITGSLDSTVSSSFTVDFYANTECDPSGFGQGRTYLGSSQPVTTDGSCAATFQASFATSFPVHFVAATATDSAGNTSEFSACIPVPAAFYSVTPCRLIDTRGATGPYGAPALNANMDRSFVIGGQCGVPVTAKAVAVNLTVTQPQALGDLRLYPGGGTLPNTSTMNYRAGQTRANNAIVNLGTQSDLVVRCVQGSGTVHFILDVTGYFE